MTAPLDPPHLEFIGIAVFFLGAVPHVDLAGAEMLIELRHALKARGVELRLAGAHASVRDALVRAGVDRSLVHMYSTVAQAASACS